MAGGVWEYSVGGFKAVLTTVPRKKTNSLKKAGDGFDEKSKSE